MPSYSAGLFYLITSHLKKKKRGMELGGSRVFRSVGARRSKSDGCDIVGPSNFVLASTEPSRGDF